MGFQVSPELFIGENSSEHRKWLKKISRNLNEFQATFRQGIKVMWVAVVHKVLYCYCLKISGKNKRWS